MDFRGRGNQTPQPAPRAAAVTPAPAPANNSASSYGRLGSGGNSPRLFKVSGIVLLFALTALVISIIFLIAGNGNAAMRSVQKAKYQAVFLNNGQVYFGNIKTASDKTIDLRNIYYLQTSGSGTDATQSTTTASNVSLVKLGCELHAPYDQMLINKDQVLFWENIQDSSQVVKAINDYKSKNSSGQQCSQASQNSTQQAPSSSSTSTTPATTGTSSTTKKP